MIDRCTRRYRLTKEDLDVYDLLLPYNHILQDFLNLIDWEKIALGLESYYNSDRGRPGIPPIYLLKMEFLRYFYRLSDGEVFERCRTDIAFRWFLQLPTRSEPPDSTTLCKFRGRIGQEGFQKIFDQIIHQARVAGLVKDRLRLKDASHVIASIAIPSSLQLLAQLRDRLLKQIAAVDPLVAEGFRVSAAQIHQETEKCSDTVRLENRARLLNDILAWIDQSQPSDGLSSAAWQQLLQTRGLAKKILNDQTDPDATDKILSLVDPEARRGMHGDWFEGYKVDMLVDPDSELITQINVIAASGNEASNCVTLVTGEQQTFGNQIETVSIDRAGYDGAMIRELEGKANVEVIVPPKKRPETKLFTSDDFTVNEDGSQATCPAGAVSCRRNEELGGRRVRYTFAKATCAGCPLLNQCMNQLPKGRMGRAVSKNEYEAEYARVAARATTEHYHNVRREHPLVERKFTEPLNRHGGRRTPYRGMAKTTMHELMAATVTNVKRMVNLLLGSVRAVPA
jgi:IS5 family transposase